MGLINIIVIQVFVKYVEYVVHLFINVVLSHNGSYYFIYRSSGHFEITQHRNAPELVISKVIQVVPNRFENRLEFFRSHTRTPLSYN